MNDVLIHALAARVKAWQMTIEHVPEVFRAAVQEIVAGGNA